MSASDINEKTLLKLLSVSKIIAGTSDIEEAVKVFAKTILDAFYFSGVYFTVYSKEKEELSFYSYYSDSLSIPTESLNHTKSLFGNENVIMTELPLKNSFTEYKDLPAFLKKTFETSPFKNYMSENGKNTFDIKPYLSYAFNLGSRGDIVILYFLVKEHSFSLSKEKLEGLLSFVQTLKSAFTNTSTIKSLEGNISKLKENNLEKEMQLTGYKDMLDTYENILTVSSHELVDAQSTITAMQVVEEMSRRELLDVKQSMDSYKEILSVKKKRKKESTFKNIYNALSKWVLHIRLKKYKDKRFIVSSALLLVFFIMVIVLLSRIFTFISIASYSPDTAYLLVRTGRAKINIEFLKSRAASLKNENFLNSISKYPLFDLKLAAGNEGETPDNNSGASRRSSDNLLDVENQNVGPVTQSLTLKGMGQIPNGWSVILSVNSEDTLLKLGEIFKGYTLIKIDSKKGFAIIRKERKVYKLFVNKSIKVTR